MTEKILVIRLGTLGDFILALGTMEAIRRHHKDAHITLLTMRPFLDVAQRSSYFDDIIIDIPPKFYELHRLLFPLKKLKAGFTRVFDLQTEEPAGIDVHAPDIFWMTSDISLFRLKKPYVLLIPGASPAKRWPAKNYGALALKLAREGYQPVLLGTAADADVTSRIAKSCAEALDLSGQTSLYDIAALARGAAMAIGNDTGATHLAALTGCPTLTLKAENIEDISVNDVYKKLGPRTAA